MAKGFELPDSDCWVIKLKGKDRRDVWSERHGVGDVPGLIDEFLSD